MIKLAQAMRNRFAPYSITKNITEAIDEIRAAMLQGKTSCVLYLDWTDLPDDWVVLPETLDYLRVNGFSVEEMVDEDTLSRIRFANITW